MNQIVRCKNCVLPNNYPFIKFNKDGICHYCYNFKRQICDEQKLLNILDKYRSNTSEYDCLVGLSGGRDSVYALYLLKTKYKMNPLAYTYNWGFAGDMALLNVSNICGLLGVELILRTDKISQIRHLTSLNCKSLLSNIKLGMVPIVQSLDKKFLSIGKDIAQENGIDLLIHGAGHVYEQREFYMGFAGVDQKIVNNQSIYTYNFLKKLKLGLYYLKNFLANPNFLNKAFIPNLKSFYFTFFEQNKFLNFYNYVEWDEGKINAELEKIGFLKSKDFGENQWRMGDIHIAFVNYIYHELAGFTDFDEFRSHQIREGKIDRCEALKLIQLDNKPKIEAIKKFCHLVDIDFDYFIKTVKQAKKKNNYI